MINSVKKMNCCLLAASMLATGVVGISGLLPNEVVKAADTLVNANDDLYSVPANNQPYDKFIVMANAKASSERNNGSEGWASLAFDGNNNTRWHTNYNVSASDKPNHVVNPQTGKKQWIQTGFGKVENLKKLTYLAREGSANNKITNYELWVSQQDEEPNIASEAATGVDGWVQISDANATFGNDANQETIDLTSKNVKAKWVRLVAKDVGGSNDKWVVGTEIQLFTDEITYNKNNYAQNWQYQNSQNLMSTQDDSDRWVFEKKVNNNWQKFTTNEWKNGYWKSAENEHINVAVDGFRAPEANNKVKGIATSWVAPRVGYFKFSQGGVTPNTKNLAGSSKLHIDFVEKSGTTTTLQTLQNNNQGSQVNDQTKRMNVGDKIRISTEINATANYCDFAGGLAPWKVVDVTKQVAQEKITAATTLLNNTVAQSIYKTNLENAKNTLNSSLNDTNTVIIANMDKVEIAMNELNNIELTSLVDQVSTYKWSDATKADVTAAIDTAKASAKTVLTTEQKVQAITALKDALNKGTRLYTVTIQNNGEELSSATFTGVYNTVNTTDIIAPNANGDQAFVGWYKVKDGKPTYLVTTNKTLKVAASNDVTYNAVYGIAPEVDKTTKLLLQNAFVSYNAVTQKYDAKFVGKILNLPEGAIVTEAGLKWKVGEHTELGSDAFTTKLPSNVNMYGQYSMTITGMPKGAKITGQLYVIYTTSDGQQHTIASEGVQVLES